MLDIDTILFFVKVLIERQVARDKITRNLSDSAFIEILRDAKHEKTIKDFLTDQDDSTRKEIAYVLSKLPKSGSDQPVGDPVADMSDKVSEGEKYHAKTEMKNCSSPCFNEGVDQMAGNSRVESGKAIFHMRRNFLNQRYQPYSVRDTSLKFFPRPNDQAKKALAKLKSQKAAS